MKKILLVAMSLSLATLGFSQGKGKQDNKKNKAKYENRDQRDRDDRDDDDDDRDRRNRDDRYRDDRYRDGRYRDGEYRPGRNGRGHAYGHYKNGKAGSANRYPNGSDQNRNRDYRDRDDRDRDYRTGDSRDRDYRNGDYRTEDTRAISASSVPSAVLNAFNREYSNAKNVQWYVNRDIYIAKFETGLFNRDQQASYYRNGERVIKTGTLRDILTNRN